MLSCWLPSVTQRPSFPQLVAMLQLLYGDFGNITVSIKVGSTYNQYQLRTIACTLCLYIKHTRYVDYVYKSEIGAGGQRG